MLKDLQNGSVVLTTGGIVGTIVSINNDDTLILRVKPDNMKLQVARSAVSSLVTEENLKNVSSFWFLVRAVERSNEKPETRNRN